MNMLEFLLSKIEPVKIIETKEEFYPPGWIHNGLSFIETVRESNAIKSKSSKTKEDLIILQNVKILRTCYCTPDFILELGTYFVGKYTLDPFYNPYSLIKNEKFSELEKFKTLDGIAGRDGFNILNWEGDCVFVNPPFDKLSEAARLCNTYCKYQHEPGIIFICNLDNTLYYQECMKTADYLIQLGRINFNPLPGLKNSSPTNSSAMFVYNSSLETDTGFLTLKNKAYHCTNLKNRKITELKND